jgi:hypothetical protein
LNVRICSCDRRIHNYLLHNESRYSRFYNAKKRVSAEMEIYVIFYISITIEAREYNEIPICSSWHGLQFTLLQVFTQLTSLGLIKLQTYISILGGKKTILTFKNQWEGESVKCMDSTLCCCLHGKYNHIVLNPLSIFQKHFLNPISIFQKFPGASKLCSGAQNRPFLTSHTSGEEARKNLKFIENNALF